MITPNKKASVKPPLLIGLIVSILVLSFCAIYVYGFNGNIFGWSNPNTRPKTVSAPSSTNTIAPSQLSPIDTKMSSGSDQTQTSTTQPDDSKLVSVSITSTNQTASNYHIGVVIYSVQNSGSCTLSLSKQGSTSITQTVDIQALPSSSVCKGFDIPMSELSAGTWHTVASFSGQSVKGTISQDLNIN